MKRIIKNIFLGGIVLFMIVSAVISVVSFLILRDSLNNSKQYFNLEKINTQPNSMVYDKNQNYVSDLSEDSLITVTYEELPQILIDAFISVEDARFFSHKGIDGPRTINAIVGTYFYNSDSGGSTITQQLVKNTLLNEKILADPDYKYSEQRKIDEWILAFSLEKEISKEDIFTSYVNNAIDYGRFTGIGTASKRFFNKNVSELTLPEAALLSGIPQLPSENNPFENMETATKRYQTVLSLMKRHGFITQEEYDACISIPLSDLIIKNQDEVLNPNAAYYSGVSEELKQLFPESEENDFLKNYNIYTFLEQDKQQLANDIMNTDNYVDWTSAVTELYGTTFTEEENLNFQGAFTVIDLETGGIPALGTARNFNKIGVNYATTGFRSPGSSIKPILDYTPAVEKFNWSANHLLNDAPTYYSDGSQVFNYNNGSYKGNITMKKAIADSTNTTAVQALKSTGIEYASNIAYNMGITQANPSINTLYESASLGGGLETTTKEMAAAYGTLATGGIKREGRFIERIENMNGEIIYQYIPETKNVIKKSTAATLTEALIYSRNYGTPASYDRKQVSQKIEFAAKTGTSSYSIEDRNAYSISSSAEKDHWIVGYSPKYSIASWSGLNVENEETLLRTGGNKNATKHITSYMLASFMNNIEHNSETFNFLKESNSENEVSNNNDNNTNTNTTSVEKTKNNNVSIG